METSKNKQTKYYILGILVLAILIILTIPNLIVSTLDDITQVSGMQLSKAQKEEVKILKPGSVSRKWM